MKHLTLIGIGMVLLAVLLLYASSLQFENNFANNTAQSIILTPHNSFATSFQILNTTVLGAYYYANSTNVSYYVVDSKVFSQISQYLNSSTLLNNTQVHEGGGVYEIIYENSSGVFPNEAAYLKPPNYYYNGTAIIGNGTYYNVFQNNGNTTVLVYYSIVQKLQLSVNNSILSSTIYGLIAALMFLAGIGVVGYSMIVRKDAPPKDATDDKNVDALYAKFESSKTSTHHAKKAHKKKKQN